MNLTGYGKTDEGQAVYMLSVGVKASGEFEIVRSAADYMAKSIPVKNLARFIEPVRNLILFSLAKDRASGVESFDMPVNLREEVGIKTVNGHWTIMVVECEGRPDEPFINYDTFLVIPVPFKTAEETLMEQSGKEG